MRARSPSSPLQEALTLHQRGELEQAVRIYRTILEREPDNADALHLLGVAALQCGQGQQAIELLERSVSRRPGEAAFHADLATAYRACNQAERALNSYQMALRLQPASAEAAIDLGTLLMQVERPAEAAAVFRHAIQHQPNHPVAYNNLGNALRVLGDFQQAVACFRRAIEIEPGLSYAHGNLGQLLLDCGQIQQALPYLQASARLDPKSAAAHNNLGNAHRHIGQYDQARACYTEALRLNPNLAIVHDNLGRTLLEESRYEEAAPWFQQALSLAPGNPLFRLHLGQTLIELRQFQAAEEHLRAAAAARPRDLEIHFQIGRLCYEQGRIEEAQAIYRALLQEVPEHPIINQQVGELLLELNQKEEALACFRTARRGNPRFAPALAQLANHLRDQLPDDERSALLTLIDDPALPESDRVALLYGVSQVCDAAGDYDTAAHHLERANAIELGLRRKRGQEFNAEAHVRFVKRLRSVFTRAFFERTRGFGLDSERPVFIVGLPRSGTSLLEQVLASHSRVYGAGERFFCREGFEKLGGGSDGIAEMRAFTRLETIDADTVRQLAAEHLAKIDAVNRIADRVIDKMPENYQYVGFLRLLFPQARILHCRRDLRDVAVSCWTTQFRSLPWANDLQDMAARFTQYQRIMEHWHRVLPGVMMDVDYEDMVDDLEAVARRVVAFCGLEWEPACLEFYRTSRPVRTASVMQVRQPIYRHAVARWRNYEKGLRPLFDRLERLGEGAVRQEPEEAVALSGEDGR
jgi:tetratricopeptide (TPR) repeat protein